MTEVNVGLLLHVNGHLTENLGGIGVKENLAFAANGTNFINGLERAILVVDGHDGDEDGIGLDGVEEGGEVNASGGGFDGEVADVEALAFEGAAGIEYAHFAYLYQPSHRIVNGARED